MIGLKWPLLRITVNISLFLETEKAKDQWIRCRLLTTGDEKYVKRSQALIIKDDPQRPEERVAVNRNKVTVRFKPDLLKFTSRKYAALCKDF